MINLPDKSIDYEKYKNCETLHWDIKKDVMNRSPFVSKEDVQKANECWSYMVKIDSKNSSALLEPLFILSIIVLSIIYLMSGKPK